MWLLKSKFVNNISLYSTDNSSTVLAYFDKYPKEYNFTQISEYLSKKYLHITKEMYNNIINNGKCIIDRGDGVYQYLTLINADVVNLTDYVSVIV